MNFTANFKNPYSQLLQLSPPVRTFFESLEVFSQLVVVSQCSEINTNLCKGLKSNSKHFHNVNHRYNIGTTYVNHRYNIGTTYVNHRCNIGTTYVTHRYNIGTTYVNHRYNIGTTYVSHRYNIGTTYVIHRYNIGTP